MAINTSVASPPTPGNATHAWIYGYASAASDATNLGFLFSIPLDTVVEKEEVDFEGAPFVRSICANGAGPPTGASSENVGERSENAVAVPYASSAPDGLAARVVRWFNFNSATTAPFAGAAGTGAFSLTAGSGTVETIADTDTPPALEGAKSLFLFNGDTLLGDVTGDVAGGTGQFCVRMKLRIDASMDNLEGVRREILVATGATNRTLRIELDNADPTDSTWIPVVRVTCYRASDENAAVTTAALTAAASEGVTELVIVVWQDMAGNTCGASISDGTTRADHSPAPSRSGQEESRAFTLFSPSIGYALDQFAVIDGVPTADELTWLLTADATEAGL
ncbi:MAG: hypothetical protein Rubg2KO_15580 [Rubricoccaceae bacterium]